MQLIDTHAHLDFPEFDRDREKVIKKAGDAGVKYIINVGADLESSGRSVEMAHNNQEIFAAVGIHPHDADQVDKNTLRKLKELSGENRVVAVGEIGLDYYYDNSPREKQREVFLAQLNLAKEVGLPVVIHSREADKETIEILKQIGIKEIGGILHCFSSDLEMAKEVLDLGLYLAFGGIITFKNAVEQQRVVKEIPLERILIETDAPYLTPHPFRGKRNEPFYVKIVAEKVAELKAISLEEVARVTTENALRVYGLEKMVPLRP